MEEIKGDLKAMQEKIEAIETLCRELQDLGVGIPAVEKNTRNILSFTRILKFGIGDPAELADG